MTELQAFSVIITANIRQAFYLRESLSSTSNTKVISFSQFLQSKVNSEESAVSKTNGIMTDFEDREVWEQVIKKWQRSESRDLVNVSATARMAKQAFETFVTYELPDFDTKQFSSSESTAMKQWMSGYQGIISKRGVLTSVIRDAYIIDEIINGKVNLPNNVAFYGFYSPNVKEFKLINWAAKLNIPHFSHDEDKMNVFCRSFEEVSDEIATCAAWVKSKLENDSATTVGVVVPDILKHKDMLQQVFDHVLVPESIYQPISNHERPYRISVGSPLLSYSAIKTFFDIFKLRLNSKFLFDDISMFLRNPLIGGSKEEYIRRAKLDIQIRKLGSKKVSWATLKRIANTHMHNGLETDYYCPDLVLRMQAHEDWLIQNGKGRLSYFDMANVFRRTAEIWGMFALLGSAHHAEIVSAFIGDEEGRGVIPSFAELGNTLSSVGLVSAIAKLKNIANETKFQPSSGSSQIQIMSESDALGVKFDAVWVLGLSANNWPKRTQPNPFILQEIQVEKGVPHANAEQELSYAKFSTYQITTSAKESVLSCHVAENGEEIRPSSILLSYGKLSDSEIKALPNIELAKKISGSSIKDVVIDNIAPALDMSKPVHGGTSLFKSQAQCPFKGFVENRLGIRKLETPEVGLSASIRGDVLHMIFEHFWRDVKDQETLKTLELSGGLNSKVASSVKSALSVFVNSKPDIFTARIVDVESKRLIPLTCKWMRDVELNRPIFSNVEVEVSQVVNVKGMQMKVKMDHSDIDDVTKGLNIADNKTGQVTVDDWFSERLLEPQVPLYAIIESEAGNTLNSIVFKRIKNGEMSVKGVSDDGDAYPRFKPASGMDGVIGVWKNQIDDLADEYQTGVANISPAKETKSCTYCALKSACRYHLN
jgi:ATP-dependent helicase/nuclease subunit B